MPTIAVKYVNAAKPDKKFGSIKDTAGTVYFVPKDMVGQFQPGSTVTVETETQQWSNGPVQVVKGSPATQSNVSNQTPSTPATTGVAQTGYQRPAANDNARSIFVTGVVGRAMGSGKFDVVHMDDLTATALRVYDARMAA